MVDMEASEWVGSEGSLADFVEFEVGHFGIGSVFDGGNWFAVDNVISDLAEEDAVGADVFLGAMGGNGFSYEIGRDRALDKDLFWFLF